MKKDVLQELKPYLSEYATRNLSKSKSGLFVCPACGSGNGPKKSGALSIRKSDRGQSWKCFSCGRGGDITDLYFAIKGNQNETHTAEEYSQAARDLCMEFGLSFPETRTGAKSGAATRPVKKEPEPEPRADYTALYKEWATKRGETDYISRRGISEETAARFLIGFCPAWKSPKAGKRVPTTPRLIIPTSRESYLARDTRAIVPAEQKDYEKLKVGRVHMFNSKEFTRQSDRPIFIVEGEIDALSIIEAGAAAVGLGSIVNWPRAVDLSQKLPADQRRTLIICMDNDERGKAAQDQLAAALAAAEIPFFIGADVFKGYKDANDALISDRAAFIAAVDNAETQAGISALLQAAEEAERIAAAKRDYLESSAAGKLPAFMEEINAAAHNDFIPTGFSEIDKQLNGGLFPGRLYALGAISSLGKSTLALQIADNISAAGNDVLFFALEQSPEELTAKTLSRYTYEEVISRSGNINKLPKESWKITTGKLHAKFTEEEKEVLTAACKRYYQDAAHLYFRENTWTIPGQSDGMKDNRIGVSEIQEAIENHITMTGRRPVVIVDYLQLLRQLGEKNLTDKQVIDLSVFALKGIVEAYNIPVLAVSSFNRASYTEPATMASFKESGSIEYTADVILAMQPAGMKKAGELGDDGKRLKADAAAALNYGIIKRTDEAKEKQLSLTVLKNRFGGKNREGVNLLYNAVYNRFTDAVEVADTGKWYDLSILQAVPVSETAAAAAAAEPAQQTIADQWQPGFTEISSDEELPF